MKEKFTISPVLGSDSRGNTSISWVFINKEENHRKEANMLSRLRLPANQFSKYITEQILRNFNTYTTSVLKLQPSKIIQGSEIFKSNMGEIKNFNLLRNFKMSITLKNSKNPFDRTKFFLKDIGVRNISDGVRKKKNNYMYITPTSVIMRQKHKYSIEIHI